MSHDGEAAHAPVNSGSARILRALPYLLLAAAAAGLYYLSLHFQFPRRPGTLGPDAWPKGISMLLLLVAAYKGIESLVLAPGPRTSREEIEAAATPGDTPPESHPVLLLLGMGITLAYVALVSEAGFFLCTAVYLALFLWIGGYRRRLVILATSVLGALLLMVVFMKLVYVSLPLGRPPFSAVMIGLMELMGIR